jgi:hypothetical protein
MISGYTTLPRRIRLELKTPAGFGFATKTISGLAVARRNPYAVEEESVGVDGGVAQQDYIGFEVIAKNGQSFAIR